MENIEFLAKRAFRDFEEEDAMIDFQGEIKVIEGGENEEEEDENYINRETPKKPDCMVCQENEGKYKCPGCEKMYCKPSCFTKHQKEKLCIRDKLPQAFKKLKDFTERDMLRDFGYLSNILESYDKTRKKLSQIELSLMKHQEMVRYKILADNASHRGVKIDFAPRFIERHRENISFYFTKDRVIYWVFEIILVMFEESSLSLHGESKPTYSIKRHFTDPVCEEETLDKVIKEFPFRSNDVLVHLKEDLTTVSSIEEKSLKVFIKNTFNKETALKDGELETELKDQLRSGNRFVELHSSWPIKRTIRSMILKEFPTIYLVKSSDEINFGIYFE